MRSHIQRTICERLSNTSWFGWLSVLEGANGMRTSKKTYSTMIDFTKPVRFSLTSSKCQYETMCGNTHSNDYSLVNIKWVYRHRNIETFAKMLLHSKKCKQFNPIKLYNQMEITNNNCRAKFRKAKWPCVTQSSIVVVHIWIAVIAVLLL